MRTAILFVLVLFTLCSCNQHWITLSTPVQPEPPKVAKEDPCITAIKKDTTRIHDELLKLARYTQERNQAKFDQAPPAKVPTSGPLAKLVTMTEIQPIEKMLSKLADKAGYTFLPPVGLRPLRDVIVQADVEDAPLYTVIESVGVQAGTKAEVLLDMEHGIIKLAYLGE